MLPLVKQRQTSIAYSKAKKIIVLNLKGGVGKSTFSASLASKLIGNGHTVELIDFDKQQSTNRWANGIDELPNQSYNPSLRSLSNIAVTLKVSNATDYVVIDSPANFSESDLVRYLRYVDYIVIPMQPSPIDLHASLPFINTLIEKHIFKSRQFKTLGIMSESDVYQQPFMDKELVDAKNVDPILWSNVIKWLE
ncbi:ParA family protein [Vibrio owensii]